MGFFVTERDPKCPRVLEGEDETPVKGISDLASGELRASCGSVAVSHCGGFSQPTPSNMVASPHGRCWGPSEGSLCSVRYSHSSSGELPDSLPFRMSLDSVSSECFCSSPNDHHWAGTQIFSPQAPFWTRGQLHHSDPPTFSTSTLSATHLLPSSLPPHNLHRVSELTTLSSPGIPWLALPVGCLMRHTLSRRPAQYKGKGGPQASSYLPQPILLQLTEA